MHVEDHTPLVAAWDTDTLRGVGVASAQVWSLDFVTSLLLRRALRLVDVSHDRLRLELGG